MARISVVVPYAGRFENLQQCVASLRQQTLESEAYEAFIIDDGGHLNSEQLVTLNRHPVRVIQKPHTGVCGTRNVGIECASSELVAFLDDDCVAAPELLERYVDFVESHPSLAGVGGRVLSAPQKGMLAGYARYRGLLSGPIMIGDQIQTVITANACFRKESLIEVGCFEPVLDEYFASCGGEDADLCFKITAMGRELGYCSGAVAYHHHRTELRSFLRQHTRNGEGLLVHARLRGRPMSDFGFPEPRLASVIGHLLMYAIVSTKTSESLVSRCVHYFRDRDLSLREKLIFPFVDLLRRFCYIVGICRGRFSLRRLADAKNSPNMQRSQQRR